MVLQSPRRFVALLALLALAALVGTAWANHNYTQVINATEGQEVPAPSSPSGGSAKGLLLYDTDANTITYDVTCSSMSGSVTAAHIHAYAGPGQTAGVKITFTEIEEGHFKGVASYPDTAEANLLGGATYFNAHTTNNAPGQVRDQIDNLVAVGPNGSHGAPGLTPVGAGALALAVAGVGFVVLRRRSRAIS